MYVWRGKPSAKQGACRLATPIPNVIQAIVDAFSTRPEVAAIALGGSIATQQNDPWSDHDVYVYIDAEIPLEYRRNLAERFDPAPEIDNTWFGVEDAWTDRETGVSIDLIYWKRHWFEQQLRDAIERHRPSLGYSTSLWRTARNSTPLFDRDGWFAGMQELARAPYPEPLREAIVAFNRPLLRASRSSYRHQIELAIGRNDPVSVQHRTTALLASVFDIVFAVHRQLHPGEMRLLDHLLRIENDATVRLDALVRDVIRATGDPAHSEPARSIDALCDAVDRMLEDAGLPSG